MPVANFITTMSPNKTAFRAYFLLILLSRLSGRYLICICLSSFDFADFYFTPPFSTPTVPAFVQSISSTLMCGTFVFRPCLFLSPFLPVPYPI